MQQIFRSPLTNVRATIKSDDHLVIGISFHANPRPGGGQLSQLNERYEFSFSFVDISCVMRFPYPAAEVQGAIAAVAEFSRRFRRVVMLGSSVGGFAALNFAAAFGAETAITASPIFSFNPQKMPGDNRWQAMRAPVTAFPFDNVEESLSVLRKVYVLYDPFSPDVPHVAAIEENEAGTVRLAVPFGGHPVFGVLNQGGTLGGIIEDIVADRFSRDGFREALHRSRPASTIYLKNLAAALPQRRDALRVKLLELAYGHDKATETQLAILPPLVRLGRMKDVRALTQSVVDFEARQIAQKRELRERYDALKEENDLLKRKLKKSKAQG